MAAKRKTKAAKPTKTKAATAKAKPKAVKKRAAKKAVKKAPPAKKAAASQVSVSLAGKQAPAFSLPSDDGKTVSLKDLRGKRVVLYFYPKDDTPGCTTEACAFRDALPDFSGADAVVLGVSKDSVASHQKFKTKFKLNFPLLSDTAGVCEAYGVWKLKNMYGRTYMGIERSTFIIDANGKVSAEWRKVSVSGHAAEVIKTLRAL